MEVRDANRDGLIQRADFNLVVERYRKMGASEEHLKKINSAFESLYTKWGLVDDSTALTYDEFASRQWEAMPESGFKERGAKLFSGMFQIVDGNGDGEISFQEWVDYYKALGINTDYARASFDAMDTNSDGIISMEEFTVYSVEFFFSAEDTLNSSIMYGPLDWNFATN